MRKLCTCKHPFQDKRHGKGKRIHNETAKSGYRCTVCGSEKFK